MTFLGIDLGTSALKAVLVDEAQAILAEAAVPLATHSPRPGWFEQNPEDWWQALEQALAELRAAQPDAFGAASARSGFRARCTARCFSTVPATPIRPAILWNDGRATAECAALEAAVPDLAADRRHHRDAGLHRAEAPLAEAA